MRSFDEIHRLRVLFGIDFTVIGQLNCRFCLRLLALNRYLYGTLLIDVYVIIGQLHATHLHNISLGFGRNIRGIDFNPLCENGRNDVLGFFVRLLAVGDQNYFSRFRMLKQPFRIGQGGSDIGRTDVGRRSRDIIIVDSVDIIGQLYGVSLVETESYDTDRISVISAVVQNSFDKLVPIFLCAFFRIGDIDQKDNFVVFVGNRIGEHDSREHGDRKDHDKGMKYHRYNTVSRSSVLFGQHEIGNDRQSERRNQKQKPKRLVKSKLKILHCSFSLLYMLSRD